MVTLRRQCQRRAAMAAAAAFCLTLILGFCINSAYPFAQRRYSIPGLGFILGRAVVIFLRHATQVEQTV